jgi:hypothetical protein
MAKNKKITVQGAEISLLEKSNTDEDYISLTDIMKKFDDEFSIYSWMRNKNTVDFLGTWEQLNNPVFKGNEFVTFKNQAGANNFNLTPQKWIKATDAVGITVKAGRYGGGTFAHRDIAINFCYWLSPIFQLYLIKEFQRLKIEEAKEQHDSLEWNVKRMLSKVNYKIQSDAIRQNLIPANIKSSVKGAYYASEADLLNVALFGMTAKEWRNITQGDKKRGNLRDNASPAQLLVLANLETHNAEFIKDGLSQEERLHKLNEIAIYQMELLVKIDLKM